MRFAVLSALLLICLPGVAADSVAVVAGQEILRSEIATSADEAAQVARLRDLIWARVIPHYVAERRLAATPAEIAELLAYNREFDRRDRAQRARKLEELNQRLGKGGLGSDERAWLEEFRAVLTRLAEHDAENDRRPPPDSEREALRYGSWVEAWKTNRALYEQYGGTVALTRAGPAAHGARAALIMEYERRGIVRFLDPRLRERLLALLAQPPAMVVAPERVDFTPYWRWPIPPSYFPD